MAWPNLGSARFVFGRSGRVEERGERGVGLAISQPEEDVAGPARLARKEQLPAQHEPAVTVAGLEELTAKVESPL